MGNQMKREKPNRRAGADPERFSEMIAVFSEKVPGLVKGLITSVFSEDAATTMAKAAGAYYKGLKSSGLPEDVAVQMTKEYMATFTRMSEMFRGSKGFGLKLQDASKSEVEE